MSSHGTPTLRPATVADTPGIAAAFDAAVLHGWDFMPGIETRVPMFTPEQWEDTLAGLRRDHWVVVAEDVEGSVLGFVGAKPDEGELYLLFVRPDAAGRGLGRRLLDEAHDVVRAHGYREIFLYTHEDNRRSRAVYTAAGYRPDGGFREEPFGDLVLREVRLVRALEPPDRAPGTGASGR